MENIDDNSMSNTKEKKRVKYDRSKHVIEGRDYISDLPYSAMLCIFSLLPLKELVLASLVSKQWKNSVMTLLSELPSTLHFDELEMDVKIIRENSKILQSCFIKFPFMYTGREKFTQFVNRTLYLHTGCFVKKLCFNLCFDGLHNSQEKVDKWIHFALTNRVKKLELDFSNGLATGYKMFTKSYELPHIHFVSKSLECVKLHFCTLKTSNLGAFGSLKRLFLKYVTVLYFSIEDLMTKCPMMKNLRFEYCSIPLNFMICEKDIMIESLIMITCYTQHGRICPIDISAPKLRVLVLEEFNLTTITNVKAPNLIDVDIAINKLDANRAQQKTLVKLLTSLTCCKGLSLNSWCIQVLSYGAYFLQQPPILFNNITHIQLQFGFEKQELPGIAYIMRSCPYMETLTLDIKKSTGIHWGDLGEIPIVFDLEVDHYWQTQVSQFHCLEYHLKVVEIFGIYGSSCEMQMLQFILKNAKVLESMSLCIPKENSYHVLQQLSTYQKASPQVVISSI